MRKHLKVIALTSLSIFTMASLFIGAFAWFANVVTVGDMTINGESDPTFFAYGDGTSSKPYGINTPRHLYNLAWLQYNGAYNHDSNNDGQLDKQYYFEIDPNLTGSLDMSGWVLPPIGTETYPFLGNFNGNGKTITNLTVSNKSDLTKPTSISYNVQPEIVGFFGVVGKCGNTPTYTYATATNSIYNVTLKNITVESKTSQTLIGLAGGYVNGELSGVKIDGTATLDVNGQVSTAKTAITDKLSDYGLVGYTTKVGNRGSYSRALSEYFNNGEGSGSGEESDWGGSVNAQKYGRIIYDAFKKPGTGTHGLSEDTSNMSSSISTVNNITKTDYKIAMSTTTRTWVNSAKTYYSPYADPDYFDNPQDGATASTKVSGGTVVYHLKDSTYAPLKFTEDNNGTASDNTGYIVGDTSGNAGVVKIASYYPSSIVNSLSNTNTSTTGVAVSDKTTTYVDSNLELLTYNLKDSSWYRIQDSHNINRAGGETTNSYLTPYSRKTVDYLGFEKYEDSRTKLQRILENSSKVQGIHFDFKEISSTNLLSVANNIKINGTTYNSAYQLPKGSIDFNLKRTGYINFFAGTYYSSVVYNFGFFTLNHISRTGGTINSIKKISQIYQNKYWSTAAVSSSQTNPKFFYKYSDGTFSNIVVNNVTRAATLADRDTTQGKDGMLFDVSTVLEGVIGRDGNILRQQINNVMFYFEVPVNDGEYCMGMPASPSGITSYVGAYMIYLDIGANGDTVSTDKISAYSITTVSNAKSYPLGVDFAPVTIGNNGGESMGVFINSSNRGVLTLNITSASIAVTDTNAISNYAFQGTKFSASDPPSGNFTVSGNSPGPMPVITTGGTRVLIINVTTTDDDEYTVRVTDVLSDTSGTISSSIYEIDSGSGFVTSTAAAVEALSTDIVLVDLRSLVTVATLTRASGNAEFVVTYDEENCSYEDKIVDVDIELNGTTITIGVTTGYTFKIGGVSYSNSSSYPAS